MVFGTTYCKISHLPIEDGDTCILIPLGFEISSDFTRHDKANVNSFLYLYQFISPVQEVVYNGNPWDITYLDKDYERMFKHELYMLVRKDFYEKIISEFWTDHFSRIEIDLHCSKTMKPIFKKCIEIKNDFQQRVRAKLFKGEIDREEFMRLSLHTPTPLWARYLYQVTTFMDKMGIVPTPSASNDQSQHHLIYEKFRQECSINTTKNE